MISREEFATLQEKLVQISKKKEEYEALIAEKTKEFEEYKSVCQKIEQIQSSIQIEEQAQNKELSEASAEVHNFRPDSPLSKWNIFDREKSKVPKLEATLASQEEKLEKLKRNGIDLKATDEENEEKIQSLMAQLNEIEQRIEKVERLTTCVPPSAPIILQIDDLERNLRFFTDSNKEALTKIPSLLTKAEELETKVQLAEAQLERIMLELQSIKMDIEQQDSSKNEQFKNLQILSNELNHVNTEMRTENTNCSAEHAISEKLELEQQTELTEIRKKIIDLKKDHEAFPDQMKGAHDDNSTMLTKKKQLSEQLEKKLADVRQELMLKQSNTDIVQQLTAKLEEHWIQHQRILDQYEKKKELLQKKKDDLNRKTVAYDEINNRWPLNGKVKAKIGISELTYIYEEAMIQNRKMANDLSTLKDDLAVQEEMNATLKANLNL